MSKHNKNRDYTKYYKPQNEKIEENVNPVEEVVEETTVVENEVEDIIVPIPKKAAMGVVANCVRLNVRNFPAADAPIVCEIPCNAEVEVDLNDDDNGFVKVVTASGVEGYCMKKYIAIR